MQAAVVVSSRSRDRLLFIALLTPVLVGHRPAMMLLLFAGLILPTFEAYSGTIAVAGSVL
jgi:hypothetical protein